MISKRGRTSHAETFWPLYAVHFSYSGGWPTSSPRQASRASLSASLMRTRLSPFAYFGLPTIVAPMRLSGVLSELEIAKIFASIEQIAELSQTFASELEERVKGWSDATRMSALFLGSGTFGKLCTVYTQYVNNYEQSQRVLKQCEERVEVSLFIKHWALLMRATGQSNASMGDLLIQPVQRLPRYKMLLEQLLKLTPASHAERPKLEAALDNVSRFATAVNEAVRRRDVVLENAAGGVEHACSKAVYLMVRRNELIRAPCPCGQCGASNSAGQALWPCSLKGETPVGSAALLAALPPN